MNRTFISKLGKKANTCMISYNKKTISIYELGFYGDFSSFIFFVDGKERSVCSFCKSRIKNSMNHCNPKSFCSGFYVNKNEKNYQGFNFECLVNFLKENKYEVVQNFSQGFRATTSSSIMPNIYILLFR